MVARKMWSEGAFLLRKNSPDCAPTLKKKASERENLKTYIYKENNRWSKVSE